MFYLREFFYRLYYCLMSLILILIFCLLYKNVLFIIFFFSILTISDSSLLLNIDHFIYTHPIELFNIYIIIIYIFFFYFIFPYLIWQVLDFLKTGFYTKEFQKIKFLYLLSCFIFLSCNLGAVFYLLPHLWSIFYSLNSTFEFKMLIDIYYELKIKDYFFFIFLLLYYINLFLIFLFLIYLIIMTLPISKLIKQKKIFILINLLVATFLSPPDLLSQFFLLFFLTAFFEFGLIIFNIVLKYIKYNKFNMVKN